MRDRDLVRLYWPPDLRGAFDALFALDDAMGDVVRKAREPAIAAIKLAWWREQLEGLDSAQQPHEPRLRSAAKMLLPMGVSGAELSALETGWAGLLQPVPDMPAITDRGARLFAIGAKLLGVVYEEECLGSAGRLFARVNIARRGFVALDPALEARRKRRFERKVRPLTALAALAARDVRAGGPPFEPEATFGRAMTLLRHRFTGRLRLT